MRVVSRNLCLCGCLFVLISFLAPSAGAYEIRPFAQKNRKATLEDFLPKVDARENRHNKFYAEQYSFAFSPEDDYSFWFQIVVTNMGVANGRAALRVDFSPKGKDEIETRTSFKRDEWSYSSDGGMLSMKLGENVFSGDGKTWKGHFVNERFTADCTITNSVPAYRPGGGTVYFGEKNNAYYDSTLLTPRGTFEADVVMKDTGDKHHLTGLVFGDNSVSNMAPNLQARNWIRMRKIGKRHTVSMTMLKTSEQYQNRWVGYFFVASDKRMIGCGTNPEVEVADFERDAKSGYQVPRIVLLSEGAGVDEFSGAIKAGKLTKRRDRLAMLGSIERAVVSKFVQPVFFTYKAAFEFRFKSGGKARKYTGKTDYDYEQTAQ